MSAATREFTFHDLVVRDRVFGYNTWRDSFDPAFEQILVLLVWRRRTWGDGLGTEAEDLWVNVA